MKNYYTRERISQTASTHAAHFHSYEVQKPGGVNLGLGVRGSWVLAVF